MRNPRQVAVVGVSGYTGLELARILLRHSALQPPVFYVRETNVRNALPNSSPVSVAGAKRRFGPFRLTRYFQQRGRRVPCHPHGSFRGIAPDLLDAGAPHRRLKRSIPLSQGGNFTSWYKLPAPTRRMAFGGRLRYFPSCTPAKLPSSSGCQPGCYATSVILALRPLTQAACLLPGPASFATASPAPVAWAKTLVAVSTSSSG